MPVMVVLSGGMVKGDTAILLAQKLPLPSSRLIEQLKYWKVWGRRPQALSHKLRHFVARQN